MKQKEEEREQTDGETESERACVCECRSVPKIASVDIHKQREIEKHIWLQLMDGIFDQLAKMFWERSEIMFLTADLITRLRYLDRRQFQKEGLSDNYPNGHCCKCTPIVSTSFVTFSQTSS
jgi:hypothetical protein